MRFTNPVLMILLALPVGSAAAQQQQPPQQQQAESPAEAARRAREQKKDPAKPAKVWDNDNVPTAGRAVNVVGKSPESTSGAANQSANAQGTGDTTATSSKTSDVRSPKDTAAAQAQLSASKSHLQSMKADLDLLVRKFTLDSQTYFSNPNHASDKAGADAVADEQSQIEAKQQEVDAEQKKVDELAEKLRDSGAAAESSSSPQN
jgi:hypothetical protein